MPEIASTKAFCHCRSAKKIAIFVSAAGQIVSAFVELNLLIWSTSLIPVKMFREVCRKFYKILPCAKEQETTPFFQKIYKHFRLILNYPTTNDIYIFDLQVWNPSRVLHKCMYHNY